MRTALASLTLVTALALGCGGASTTGSATLSGKVSFSDGSDASGLVVNVLGQAARRVTTGAGGTYAAETLPDGVYVVTVEAPDTLELKLSYGAEVKGASTAPDLVFTPVGTVSGTVNSGGAPAALVSVELAGLDARATTDATGAFSFRQVPSGQVTVVATQGALVATAQVQVKRGLNAVGALALMADPARQGTVTGTLSLPSGTPVASAPVSAAAGLSAMTGAGGEFTLKLPAGDYELFVDPMVAPYPRQSLGRVTVRAGETAALGQRTLTAYASIPMPSGVTAGTVLGSTDGDLVVARISVPTDYGAELWALDVKTLQHRVLSAGNVSAVAVGRQGHAVGWISSFGYGVFLADPRTGAVVAAASAGANGIYGLALSTDETTLFFETVQNGVYALGRLKAGQLDFFPGTASTGSIAQLSADHYLVRSSSASPFDVQLVTPTTAAVVFAQVTQMGTSAATSYVASSPTLSSAYGAACTTNCTVKVLGPNTETPLSVVTGAALAAPLGLISGSTRDWLGFTYGMAGGSQLVKVSDATTSALPASTTELRFNEPGTRAVVKSVAGNYDLREGAMPLNPAVQPFATVALATPEAGAYLTASRYAEFVGGPAPKRYDVKTGVATTDGDVVFNFGLPAPLFAGAAVVWTKQSNQKHGALVGDSGELSAEPLLPLGVSSTAVARKADGTLGDFAAVSDGANAVVFDAVKKEARPLVAASVSALTAPAPDRFTLTRTTNTGITLQFFDGSRALPLSEPGVRLTSVAGLVKGATVALGLEPVSGDTPRRLLFALVP
ncbi:MAG: hypothetical protein K1X89_29775 [Myxococcaceae bacterium]|nr:hypothetical protein [Myxococcaceae bacterium]